MVYITLRPLNGYIDLEVQKTVQILNVASLDLDLKMQVCVSMLITRSKYAVKYVVI